MTKQQVKEMLLYLSNLWSSFEVSELTADVWHDVFADTDAEKAKLSIQTFAKFASSPYPPTPQEIFEGIRNQTVELFPKARIPHRGPGKVIPISKVIAEKFKNLTGDETKVPVGGSSEQDAGAPEKSAKGEAERTSKKKTS